MGRCNNQRARDAAETLKNTPSRARFSKNPAARQQKKKHGRGNSQHAKKAPAPAVASVVAKIAKRMETKDVGASKEWSKGPLDGVNVSKLDDIKLSEEAIRLVSDLLGDLNVIQTKKTVDLLDPSSTEKTVEQHEVVPLSEYNDDFIEQSELTGIHWGQHGMDHDMDWEGETETGPANAASVDRLALPHSSDRFRHDPIFVQLTGTLSFSEDDVTRAMQALETWGSEDKEDSKSRANSRLSHALDWLCLHLSEDKIKMGLKPRPGKDGSLKYSRPAVISAKAIPHPSISVAVKLTDDVEWQRRTLLNDEAVKFLSLGFQYSEALQACEDVGLDASTGDCPENNLPVLRALLSRMEQGLLGIDEERHREVFPNTDVSDEVLDEKEALSAIYDDLMTVQQTKDGAVERYCFRLKLDECPAGSEMPPSNSFSIHVLVRPGYPDESSPFLFLSNSSVHPAFLREVNEAIALHAVNYIGAPMIFELVTFATSSLPEMYSEFLERRKSEPTVEDKGGSNLMEDIQSEDERMQKQAERIGRVQEESKNIRSLMADRAMKKRAQEQEDAAVEKEARLAMLAALNEGESIESARSIANGIRNRKSESILLSEERESAEITEIQRSEDVGDELEASKLSPVDNSVAVPSTTLAFLDRLRAMYTVAAEAGQDSKVCRLSEAQEEKEGNHDGADEDLHVPRPVSVPIGDVANVLEVVKGQSDQTWLVSEEARAPIVVSEANTGVLHEVNSRKDEISKKLKEKSLMKRNTAAWKRMFTQRKALPAFAAATEIVDVIGRNQVSIVCGATGSGKSTQVPQFILDDMIEKGIGSSANMIITQPRRISAIGVAERVASERAEGIGEMCGYSIKLEKKWSKQTRLLFCTTGILLRRLQCDPDLASISHIFVDEVHERDLNTDFLLVILKDLLMRRKSLKLVLMSATVNAELFSDFFGGCAIVSIPGRTFPVEEFRLEDVLALTGYEVKEDSDCAWKGNAVGRPSKSFLRKLYYPRYKSSIIHSLSVVNESIVNYDLLSNLLEHICTNQEPGAILVFLPGIAEIRNAIDELRKKELFQTDSVIIYPLHSALSSAEQKAVFQVPPMGVRKIVVATNIAETSITIEDIAYVIDSGRMKENRRDEVKGTPELVECWVSRSSAKQRKGRAGRVRSGTAYQLFSSHTHNTTMQEHQLPEMLRVGLEDMVLDILVLDLGEPGSFLSKSLDPPSSIAFRNAISELEGLGAVQCVWENGTNSQTKNEEKCDDVQVEVDLTALGYNLAMLPVEPRVGKMIIYGALFGCIDPALTIAASMSSKSVFASSFERREETDNARRSFSVEGSDHLATLGAFNKWRELRTRGERNTEHFIRENCLSRMTLFQMEDLRRQYSGLLSDIGFLPRGFRAGGKGRSAAATPPLSGPNNNAQNSSLIKAVLCAGLYPNVIVAPRSLADGSATQEAGEYPFRSLKGEVHLHPCTLSFQSKLLESRYGCFHEMVKTRKLYSRDFTTVSPIALLLFGGKLVVHHTLGAVTVDEWLKFRMSPSSATLIKHLRAQMERAVLEKIVSPEVDLADIPAAKSLIQAVSTLLENEKTEIHRNDGSEIVRPFSLNEDRSNQRQRSSRGGRGRGRGRGRGHMG